MQHRYRRDGQAGATCFGQNLDMYLSCGYLRYKIDTYQKIPVSRHILDASIRSVRRFAATERQRPSGGAFPPDVDSSSVCFPPDRNPGGGSFSPRCEDPGDSNHPREQASGPGQPGSTVLTSYVDVSPRPDGTRVLIVWSAPNSCRSTTATTAIH